MESRLTHPHMQISMVMDWTLLPACTATRAPISDHKPQLLWGILTVRCSSKILHSGCWPCIHTNVNQGDNYHYISLYIYIYTVICVSTGLNTGKITSGKTILWYLWVGHCGDELISTHIRNHNRHSICLICRKGRSLLFFLWASDELISTHIRNHKKAFYLSALS